MLVKVFPINLFAGIECRNCTAVQRRHDLEHKEFQNRKHCNTGLMVRRLHIPARLEKQEMTKENYAQAYQRGFDYTVRLLVARGAQGDTAREAAQAAWVRGWERLAQLRNESMVNAWVNTIALNFLRRTLRNEGALQALTERPSGGGIDFAAIDVARILSFCRPHERALLEKYLQGMTMAELARENGVTETAIRIRIMRARRAAKFRAEDRAVQALRRYTSPLPRFNAA